MSKRWKKLTDESRFAELKQALSKFRKDLVENDDLTEFKIEHYDVHPLQVLCLLGQNEKLLEENSSLKKEIQRRDEAARMDMHQHLKAAQERLDRANLLNKESLNEEGRTPSHTLDDDKSS